MKPDKPTIVWTAVPSQITHTGKKSGATGKSKLRLSVVVSPKWPQTKTQGDRELLKKILGNWPTWVCDNIRGFRVKFSQKSDDGSWNPLEERTADIDLTKQDKKKLNKEAWDYLFNRRPAQLARMPCPAGDAQPVWEVDGQLASPVVFEHEDDTEVPIRSYSVSAVKETIGSISRAFALQSVQAEEVRGRDGRSHHQKDVAAFREQAVSSFQFQNQKEMKALQWDVVEAVKEKPSGNGPSGAQDPNWLSDSRLGVDGKKNQAKASIERDLNRLALAPSETLRDNVLEAVGALNGHVLNENHFLSDDAMKGEAGIGNENLSQLLRFALFHRRVPNLRARTRERALRKTAKLTREAALFHGTDRRIAAGPRANIVIRGYGNPDPEEGLMGDHYVDLAGGISLWFKMGDQNDPDKILPPPELHVELGEKPPDSLGRPSDIYISSKSPHHIFRKVDQAKWEALYINPELEYGDEVDSEGCKWYWGSADLHAPRDRSDAEKNEDSDQEKLPKNPRNGDRYLRRVTDVAQHSDHQTPSMSNGNSVMMVIYLRIDDEWILNGYTDASLKWHRVSSTTNSWIRVAAQLANTSGPAQSPGGLTWYWGAKAPYGSHCEAKKGDYYIDIRPEPVLYRRHDDNWMPTDSLDLMEKIFLIGNYPHLLEHLGLKFVLEIDGLDLEGIKAEDGYANQRFVSVEPLIKSDPEASSTIKPCEKLKFQCILPRTRYQLKLVGEQPAEFRAADAPNHWTRRGFFNMDYDGGRKFHLETCDVDAGGLKNINFAQSVLRSEGISILTDLDGIILSVNRAAVELLDPSEQQESKLLNRNLSGLITEGDPSRQRIRELSREHPTWGAPRILAKLGTPDHIGAEKAIKEYMALGDTYLFRAKLDDLRSEPWKRVGDLQYTFCLNPTESHWRDFDAIMVAEAIRAPGGALAAIRWDFRRIKHANHSDPDKEKWLDVPTDEERGVGPSAPPSGCTAGITLISNEQHQDIIEARKRWRNVLQELRDALQSNSDSEIPIIELAAHDLVIGHVPEIGAVNPVSKGDCLQWFSLCLRDEDYSRRGLPGVVGVNLPKTARGEGFLRVSATQPTDCTDAQVAQDSRPKEILASEKVFAWTGWNLSVPNTLKEWKMNPDADEEWSVPVGVTVIPGLLPPQRFRMPEEYRLRYQNYVRVRTVDLAGNSEPASTAEKIRIKNGKVDEPKNALGATLRREEPIGSPVILLDRELRDEVDPGENLRRMVIRDGCERSVRWVAPPRTSHWMAELHGMFDRVKTLSDLGGFEDAQLEDDGNFPQAPKAEKSPKGENDPRTPSPIYRPPGLFPKKPCCPYWPDPAACIAHFRLVDFAGIVHSDLSVDFYPGLYRWPRARVAKIVLLPLGRRHRRPRMEWSDLWRTLTIKLPPAWTATLQVSSGMGAGLEGKTRLQQMAIWKDAAQVGGANEEACRTLARTGLLPLVTPAESITLVHATSKPRRNAQITIGGLGQEHASAVARIPVEAQIDLKDTAKLAVMAEWTEEQDDPQETLTRERPAIVPFIAQIGELTLSEPISHRLETIRRALEFTFPSPAFRSVAVSTKSQSRFRSDFPDDPKESFENDEGNKIHVHFKNAAPPPPPDLAYIVPTFGWLSETKRGPDTFQYYYCSTRKGGGLRIYLNRGWGRSGQGELLGIVLAPAIGQHQAQRLNHGKPVPFAPVTSIPEHMHRYTTSWGMDPLWNAKATSVTPTPDIFKGAHYVGTGLFVRTGPASSPDNAVTVIGYKPEYDEKRELWYCDVVIDPVPSYKCFLRLALVRYQPRSLRGAELSEVVSADFAQLLPDRTVLVTREPREACTLQVQVHGVENPARRIIEDQDNSGQDGETLPGNSFDVYAAMCSDDGGWIRDKTIQVLPDANPHRAIWSGRLRWNKGYQGRRRLVVLESENFPKYEAGSQDKLTGRLVYADVLDL